MVCALPSIVQRWLHSKIGITLFFLCDTSIAVRTLTTGAVHDVVAFLVWTFYVPAQTLITMSYVRSVRQ